MHSRVSGRAEERNMETSMETRIIAMKGGRVLRERGKGGGVKGDG